MENNISDDDIMKDEALIPLDRLVKTAMEKYVITDVECRDIDVSQSRVLPCSAEKALGLMKRRVMSMRLQGIKEKVAFKVQLATHTTMVVVSKQNVVGDYLVQECNPIDEVYEVKNIGPMLVNERFFAKSVVVDAREVDPEVMEDGLDLESREIDVRKIEIVITSVTSSCLQVSHVFSGYDRGYDVSTEKVVRKKLYENPAVYLDTVDEVQEVRYLVTLADVRAYYTFRNFKHKKFKKYNPRQYCYFTLYVIGDGPIGELNIRLNRIYRERDEVMGRIYRGPVVRKGKPQERIIYHKYKSRKKAAIVQKPTSMTTDRYQVVFIDFSKKGLDCGEASKSYSLEKIRKESTVIELYESGENILIHQKVIETVTYSMRERDERMKELSLTPFQEDLEDDGDYTDTDV